MLNKIPEEVREHVKMLLSVTPNVRPDADQMTKVRSPPRVTNYDLMSLIQQDTQDFLHIKTGSLSQLTDK